MKWNGKIIGFLIGAFISPLACLIGIIVGHLFDIGLFNRWLGQYGSFHNKPGQFNHMQKLFFDCTFSIMGFIAKSDGRISPQEIATAQKIMHQFNFSLAMKKRAINEFNRGKNSHFDYQACLNQLRRNCLLHPGLLKTFLEIQIQIAYADGTLTPAKEASLHQIFRGLGLSDAHFQQFTRQSRAGQSYQHYRRSEPPKSPNLQDAYLVLGIDGTASNDSIKKAYRRQMSKHHPDRLMAQGVPAEMIKLATQKTQQIKSAYDALKHARGF